MLVDLARMGVLRLALFVVAISVAFSQGASPPSTDPFKYGPYKTKIVNLVEGDGPKNPPKDAIVVTPVDTSKE